MIIIMMMMMMMMMVVVVVMMMMIIIIIIIIHVPNIRTRVTPRLGSGGYLAPSHLFCIPVHYTWGL